MRLLGKLFAKFIDHPAMPLALGAALIGCLVFIFFVTPSEKEMGAVYKIFYFHVSSAMSCLVLFFGCAVLSLGYLVLKRGKLARMTDRLAHAMGEIGVLFGVIVLTTGPLWAKPAWGTYWTWEPRLTLLLLTVFLFVGYVVLRNYAGTNERTNRLAAGVAVVGIPAALLVHFAIDLWQGGNHPQVVTGDGGGLAHPDMKLAFLLTILAVALFAVYLVWMRVKHHKMRYETELLFLDISDLEDIRR